MWEGKAKHDWSQTGSILCILANLHRDRKRRSKPFTLQDFSPMHKQEQRRKAANVVSENWDDAAAIWGITINPGNKEMDEAIKREREKGKKQ